MTLLALGENDCFIAGFIASAFDFPGKLDGLSLVSCIYFSLLIKNKENLFLFLSIQYYVCVCKYIHTHIYILLGY